VKKEYEEKQKLKREKRKIKDKEKDKAKEKESKSKDEEEDKQDEKAKEDKVRLSQRAPRIHLTKSLRSRSYPRQKSNPKLNLALVSSISAS
jgi:hypothetical protein